MSRYLTHIGHEAVAKLERDWPTWQVWVVHRVIGGPMWWARRWDDEKRALNAGSASELAEMMEEQAER